MVVLNIKIKMQVRKCIMSEYQLLERGIVEAELSSSILVFNTGCSVRKDTDVSQASF